MSVLGRAVMFVTGVVIVFGTMFASHLSAVRLMLGVGAIILGACGGTLREPTLSREDQVERMIQGWVSEDEKQVADIVARWVPEDSTMTLRGLEHQIELRLRGRGLGGEAEEAVT